MTIHEPLTLATDYLLAMASIVFGALLWRRGNRLWAISFFFTACGTFAGGTFHGFGGAVWWKLTVYAIGAASLFLLLPFLRAAAIAIFAVYAVWMTVHDGFGFVIADYGITLLLLAIVVTVRWSPSSRWILGSAAVSVVAAIVQQAPIAFHNDLYHAIQLVALWLLYRGGSELTTRGTEPPTIRPT